MRGKELLPAVSGQSSDPLLPHNLLSAVMSIDLFHKQQISCP